MKINMKAPCRRSHQFTMVENRKEHRCKYWTTRSSVRSFARTAHSFACSGLLASLAPSAALTRSLARSLCSLPRSWESEFLMSQNDLILSHSALACGDDRERGHVVSPVYSSPASSSVPLVSLLQLLPSFPGFCHSLLPSSIHGPPWDEARLVRIVLLTPKSTHLPVNW